MCLALILALGLLQEHGDHPHRAADQPTFLDRVRPQEASGTAWQPAATPVEAFHFSDYGWHFMAHASIFAGFDYQTGDRGEDAWFSTNWLMFMGRRDLAGGEISLRGMASLEPWTVGDRGYPLLAQNGEGLVDRQHPHDLFMELAALWATAVTDDAGVQFYAALVGEPALGPVAFPHRHSASADPAAPLGHHWQDATHISPGVLTAAFFTRHAKLEASWFNGREPDENRTDLDLDVPDSGSVRITVNPAPEWSMQVSGGRLDEPEEHLPGVSVRRWTASTSATGGGTWSATALWGRNDPSEGRPTNAFLFEGVVGLDAGHAIFGRIEYLHKTGRDLELGAALADEAVAIKSLSAGYLHTFARLHDQEIAMGVRLTANLLDEEMEDAYGGRVEWGVLLFLRLRPAVGPDPAHR